MRSMTASDEDDCSTGIYSFREHISPISMNGTDSNQFQVDLLSNSAFSHIDDSNASPPVFDDEDEIAWPVESDDAALVASMEHLQIEDVNHLKAQELQNMNAKQRESAMNDLHGVDEEWRDPPPEERKALLQQFRESLEDRSLNKDLDRSAYDKAYARDPKWVHRDEFLIMFLRSDNWDIPKATKRLFSNFVMKLKLFSPDLLCKDITQDDLDKDSLEALYCGWEQDLPLRDPAGRIVTIFFPDLATNSLPIKAKLCRVYYSAMSRMHDDETQVKGRIFVVWMARAIAMERSHSWEVVKMLKTVPKKIPATHFCIVGEKPSTIQSSIIALVCFGFEKLLRLRSRYHCGTPQELKAILRSFGIPSSLLPIDESGLKTPFDGTRLARRREEERLEERLRALKASSSIKSVEQPETKAVNAEKSGTLHTSPSHPASSRVPAPGFHDILLGRGRLSQEHWGNMRFRQMIEEHQHQYEKASKVEKTVLAADLVSMVRSTQGRFLKEDGSMWVEVDDVTARKKVANCFRTMRHRKKKDKSGTAL
eukprot:Nitzschia sp. Nitz4//scaffold9_size221794//175589//177369//NITZ4_001373-RA/size221794-snap-gene-0.190-mRNA-1//-1//CDS//3329561082//3007//frame0